MSNIYVNIGTIAGDSTQIGFEGQIACEALQHGIDLQVVQYGASRVEGASVHANFELIHKPDRASPLLRAAAAAGSALGNVVVTRTRRVGEGTVPAEVIILGNARVSLVEMQTPVNSTDGNAAEIPVEAFHLEYESIAWDYKFYKDGALDSNVMRQYSTEG